MSQPLDITLINIVIDIYLLFIACILIRLSAISLRNLLGLGK